MMNESLQEKAVLGIRVGDTCYGLELSAVTKVLRAPKISPLPWLPEHYEGICTLSGSILPVVSLDSLHGKKLSGSSDKRTILVVNSAEYECGILVGESPFLIHVSESDKLECTAAAVTESGLVLKEQYRMPPDGVIEIIDEEETLRNIVVCE